MCGRYSLTAEEAKLRKRFSYQEELGLRPRYNIAPTQDAVVIYCEDTPRPCTMRWGLVPFWLKDEAIGNKLINARAETVSEKPAFRTAFSRRRCLVLADGFYEWIMTGDGKQPIRILMKDREPFAFAGLWDKWRREDGSELRSFTILTTEANELIRSVHTRMPVILNESEYGDWLDPKLTKPQDLHSLLRPHPPEAMEFYPVDRVVNNARHDTPNCIRSTILAGEVPGHSA